MANNSLPYADPTTYADKPQPTKHSRAGMIAIAIYAMLATGKAALWTYAAYKWHPIHQAYRLYYLIVLPYRLLTLAGWTYTIGTAFGLAGLLQPNRRRSLAVFALILNAAAAVYLLNEEIWGFALSRAQQ